ncbi:hypothetical protein ACJIZ3_020373 [Penstemon smallii]|uniref:Uncharacterized protein n=1 Tax=Penstemon smallii TaxID=265156 RepID=A0ABD3SIE8_9LAMI
MARRDIVTIVIFSLLLFFSSTQSLDEETNDKTLVSKLYATNVGWDSDSGVDFWRTNRCDPRYPYRPARRQCCNDLNSISDDCLDRNLKSSERDILSVVKTVCSDFVDHNPPPKHNKQPPPVVATPSPPRVAPSPPKQRTPSVHHKRRPEICLVDTILYDSCNPKYPEANQKDRSYFDKNYVPHDVRTGFTSDDAGCCLGFAVFTNDCDFSVTDLSFAKQRIFSRLQGECDKRSN